jgi:hypothetical protein
MGTIVDVFPITFDRSIYPLVAYGLKGGKAASENAGRLAYRVRKTLAIPCAWVWQSYRLVAVNLQRFSDTRDRKKMETSPMFLP